MASREKEQFFSIGVQYYVVARFAAFAGFTPVCGNLFHHAIELFLKGHLCESMSLADLKRLGHSLRLLWARFKQGTDDQSLDRFDQTVADLDQFESIRYPERILDLGMRCFISISCRQSTTDSNASGGEPEYQVVVKAIDELVNVIFEKASINPRYFTGALNNEARTYLTKENRWSVA